MSPFVRQMLAGLLHVSSIPIRPIGLLVGNRRIFYRDLVRCGGPGPAVQAALRGIGSQLEIDKGGIPAWVSVGSRSRSVDLLTAANERLFILQFWSRGVCLATAATPFLTDAARAIDRWVASTCTTGELAGELRFVKPTEEAPVYESGDPVEHRWQVFLSAGFPDNLRMIEFLRVAYRHPELRQLFPFTSMFSLHLSRCTGYPYTADLPWIRAGDSYTVFRPDGATASCETAEEAADLMIRYLPPDCGPAIIGSAEDLVKPREG